MKERKKPAPKRRTPRKDSTGVSPEPEASATKKPKLSTPEVIDILENMASLLEIVGANPFKIRAFTNAARELQSLPAKLPDMVASGELLDVPGIGKGIFKHIEEMLETGTAAELEELRSKVPAGLLDMLRIPGMGPKKVKTLHEELGLESIDDLEKAAHDDLIAQLPGFGEKSQQTILRGIERIRHYSKRHLLSTAMREADTVYSAISKHADVQRSMIGGSLRRARETVKDIDILVSAKKADAIMDRLTDLPSVASVVAKGSTKSSVVLKAGVNVDLRVVSDNEFPFAALYFTGSKRHNTDMRGRAKKLGY